jgi:hypothetical protein
LMGNRTCDGTPDNAASTAQAERFLVSEPP